MRSAGAGARIRISAFQLPLVGRPAAALSRASLAVPDQRNGEQDRRNTEDNDPTHDDPSLVGCAADDTPAHTAKRTTTLVVLYDERPFATVRRVGVEERFEGLRRSAAMAPLSREGVTDLLGITATLIEERKRIRRLLRQLPENFAEVRKLLNELARTVQ